VLFRSQNLLKDKGIELIWSQQLLEEIIDLGYDKLMGAREMRRIIQDNIENKLAELIISKKLRSGNAVEYRSLKEIEIK
jgi:ATP-dependent Clp protease ATP-binding subunit ClpC